MVAEVRGGSVAGARDLGGSFASARALQRGGLSSAGRPPVGGRGSAGCSSFEEAGGLVPASAFVAEFEQEAAPAIKRRRMRARILIFHPNLGARRDHAQDLG